MKTAMLAICSAASVVALSSAALAECKIGISMKTLTATHPSLEQRLEQLARIHGELSRPMG